jgi:predicted DNA-binding transcriptional regulator YafY
MSEIDRLYSYKSLFLARRIISQAQILELLEISTATFKRDLTKLRDRLNLPIIYDRGLRGYRLEKNSSPKDLSGLLFSKDELFVFSAIQFILTQFDPNLFNSKLKPLNAKIEFLMNDIDLNEADVMSRIKFLHSRKRKLNYDIFESLVKATFNRKKVSINYVGSNNSISNERIISPQQIVYYKDNWYLDAWCHFRNDVRTFSIDAINMCIPKEETSIELNISDIQKIFRIDYGIFIGKEKQWAKIRFDTKNISWIVREEWHSDQKSYFDNNGWFILEIPFSDTREILSEILKFGSNATIIEPEELRSSHINILKKSLENY